MHSTASLLTPGCGEGWDSIYLQASKQGEWAACAQKPQTPQTPSILTFFPLTVQPKTDCFKSNKHMVEFRVLQLSV